MCMNMHILAACVLGVNVQDMFMLFMSLVPLALTDMDLEICNHWVRFADNAQSCDDKECIGHRVWTGCETT